MAKFSCEYCSQQVEVVGAKPRQEPPGQILEVTPVAPGLRDGVCSKCGSRRVMKDLQLPVDSPGELPAVLRAVFSWPALFAKSAALTACICATCGYAELYADTDIEKLRTDTEGRTRQN
jgi:hypothetical protein